MTALMRRPDGMLFDHFDSVFDNLLGDINNSHNKGFPPYNIMYTENNIVLEFAVAGFNTDELDVYTQDKTLIVRGEKSKEEKIEKSDVKYTHKGIATRNFEHRFSINNNIEIENAEYENGILRVTMKTIEPTRNRIPINSSNNDNNEEQLLQE